MERAQIACSCSCMRACGRKLSCIGMRGCGRKRKGVDENSWQSRQLHRRFQRNTMKVADCVDRTEQHMQGVGWLCGTHCWACLGLDCHKFHMPLQLHTLCAIHTVSRFPPLVSCAATVDDDDAFYDSRCSAAQRSTSLLDPSRRRKSVLQICDASLPILR